MFKGCISTPTLRYIEAGAVVLITSIFILSSLYQVYNTPPDPPPEVTLIIVTATHKRFDRLADMTRLASTLKPIRSLNWVVVENGGETEPAVEEILRNSGIPYVYLCATNPRGSQTRGAAQRNAALYHIRYTYRKEKAVVYFADDDNLYDVRLFERYIRNVKKIGVWAVGVPNNTFFEVPRALDGKVTMWNLMHASNRTFSNYIASFAVNLSEIKREEFVYFNEQCATEFLQGTDSCFLPQFALPWVELEQFGYEKEPRDIFVWNTRTFEKKEMEIEDRGHRSIT